MCYFIFTLIIICFFSPAIFQQVLEGIIFLKTQSTATVTSFITSALFDYIYIYIYIYIRK